MVGFGTTKFTRAWEPALLWNQLGMGCKSPDPNRPFGDLAGGRVGGANRRLK